MFAAKRFSRIVEIKEYVREFLRKGRVAKIEEI